MNGASNTSNCPCDGFTFPQAISNPPGRSSISYRIGDYLAFREALLRSCPGEVELVNWRPGAEGDLAVQMVEWWAYLADVLTFYNERIANQDYLPTATLLPSVQGLVRLLGYRPRPGIGASGTLAALLSGTKSITLPQGFQIQSKPGPGEQPQIFELSANRAVQQPDAISAEPESSGWIVSGNSVLLQGTVSGINIGDELLVLERGWDGTDKNYAIVTVNSVNKVKDPLGATNTQIIFNQPISYLASGSVANYRLVKSAQASLVWQYPAETVIGPNTIDLAAITRSINVGDPVLLEIGSITAARGIFFSPDGTNLGGGGNTVSLGIENRTVVRMIAYQTGVITVFDDGTIYYSPDGQNLGGGGNTAQVYSGPTQVVDMIVYNGGVMTCFSDGTIYSSPDGYNLKGGGHTTQSYGGPTVVVALIPYQTGVIVSFEDEITFYSPDGNNLHSTTGTTQQLGVPSGGSVKNLAIYGANVITVFVAYSGDTQIYISNGTNLTYQQVFSGFTYGVQPIVAYGSSGFLLAVQLMGTNEIWLGSGTQNLASAQVVYTGTSMVTAMVPYNSGIMTAFDDGTVYYSPDGTNLKGGGSTVQVYGPGPLAVSLVAYGSGVITAFPIPQLLSVNSNKELIWYANAESSNPAQAPTGSPPPIAIPIPHTEIGFVPTLPTSITDSGIELGERALALVRYALRDVGTLIAIPSPTLIGTEITLNTPLPSSMVPLSSQEILISGANGNGVEADASSSDGSIVSLSNSGLADPTWDTTLASLNLAAPLNVYFDLLPVTRGQTVANEILGSGDATITTGQEFVLKKSPLTYFQNPSSVSGPNYASTLQIWVDGVEWQEVPSFYDQSPTSQVFITREDDQNLTHVQFGDGVNGARLPSGVNNVVATYRVGSGKQSPDVGSLTVILKSWPGLKSIVNPVQVGGGADADSRADMQTDAPQSVLTFGRAISADDYEVIAAQAPGVARACVYWAWDSIQQRNMVMVYVGDDQNAVNSATAALGQASDPNRPVTVSLAKPVSITIGFTLVVDPKYVTDAVVTGVTAALIDPNQGLLGANVVQIGQSLFESQIYQACMAVAGVVAVQQLTVTGVVGQTCSTCPDCDYRYDPGQGFFFSVSTTTGLNISPEVAADAS
jgi:hypothetical protein